MNRWTEAPPRALQPERRRTPLNYPRTLSGSSVYVPNAEDSAHVGSVGRIGRVFVVPSVAGHSAIGIVQDRAQDLRPDILQLLDRL